MEPKEKKRHSLNQPLYCSIIKRVVDVIFTIAALAVLSWLYVILAIIVWIKMGRPIIFSSERIGKDGKTFKIYKFRSMTNAVDENGILLPGPQRLTPFGRFLRSTSLDELPSLLNIVIGDMSIVGPRPLPEKYRPYFYRHEWARHQVRPGLTGWAQVNGRNAISWDIKFQYDLDYIKHMSFLFDLKIILLTVVKVIKRSDIIQDDQQTQSLYIVRSQKPEQEELING